MIDHDWQRSLARGKAGEARIREAAIEKWGFKQALRAGRNLDRQGVDCFFIRPNGTRVSVQVKADRRAATTGNMAYEVLSKKEDGSPGAMVKCAAQMMLYWLEGTDEVLLFDTKKLAAKRDEWERRYRSVECSTNGRFTTVSVLVPLSVARAAAEKILSL